MVTKEQKSDVKQRAVIRHRAQQLLHELYHYFQSVHGVQPKHSDIVALATEILKEEIK